MWSFVKKLTIAALGAALLISTVQGAEAAEKKAFKIAWSIYVGYMPLPYAAESGILKKWADKYGITIELTQINDYVESLNQYTAGGFDGVLITNMDTLSIPAAGGVDTSAIAMVDYSNGNDAVILKRVGIAAHKKTLADIKGQKVNLVSLSVSQYLLARALESVNLTEADISLVNTSDADMVAAFGTSDVTAVATWNPEVSEILKSRNAQKVYDSSQIPGQIQDLLVVNTATLKDNPKLGKALVGAWLEVMAIMQGNGPASEAALTQMAKDSGTDLEGLKGQLKTTRLYPDATEAASFMASKENIQITDLVRKFCFAHGLLGEGAKSVDAVGIQFPNGEVLGDTKNVKFRYNAEFEKMAADHKL